MWRLRTVLVLSAILAVSEAQRERTPVVEYENRQSPCNDAQGRSQVSHGDHLGLDMFLPCEESRRQRRLMTVFFYRLYALNFCVSNRSSWHKTSLRDCPVFLESYCRW